MHCHRNRHRNLGPIAALAVGLFAGSCLANEPTTIDTKGFSVAFPEKWHVSTNHNGTILANINGEVPPFITLYYADDLIVAGQAKKNTLERMRKSSISDVMGDGGRIFTKMVDQSQWHRQDTVDRPDGMREEQLDLESSTLDDDKKSVELCSFIRFYHGAPHAELYLAFVMDKPCDAARAEFDGFVSSIVWK